MQFRDCIGQEPVQQRLINSVTNGRVHHAQLFFSSPGGGGLALALAFAQFVNCENKQPDDSCGECNSCKKMAKLVHPAITFTFPTVKKKNSTKVPVSVDYITEFRSFILANPFAEESAWLEHINSGNRQGNITAAECMEIVKSVKLKQVEGDYKINIIWKPERFGKEGNRLLKLIEEPPTNTLFLFVAENEEQILGTILSRCQITRLAPISPEDMQDYLIANGVSEEQSLQIGLLANGNIPYAKKLSKSSELVNEGLLTDWFSCVLKRKADLQKFVDSVSAQSKESIKNLLLHGSQLCREALILQESQLKTRLPEQEEKIARWLGNRLDIDEIHQLRNEFETAFYSIERNANVKLLLLHISLRIDDIITQREVIV